MFPSLLAIGFRQYQDRRSWPVVVKLFIDAYSPSCPRTKKTAIETCTRTKAYSNNALPFSSRTFRNFFANIILLLHPFSG